jgi:Fe-S-cluster containining protein
MQRLRKMLPSRRRQHRNRLARSWRRDNRCTIYAQRPLVCRVEEYYEQHLSAQVTWAEFVRINLGICARL